MSAHLVSVISYEECFIVVLANLGEVDRYLHSSYALVVGRLVEKALVYALDDLLGIFSFLDGRLKMRIPLALVRVHVVNDCL